MRYLQPPERHQGGIALIEALVSILIFAVAVLGLVAMQANAVRFSSDARNRSEASLLVDQMISELWVVTPANIPNYAYAGSGTVPAGVNSLVTKAQASLPGVSLAPELNLPTIVVDTSVNASITVYRVTVTVFWQPPGQADVHRHSVSAFISSEYST